VAEEVRPRRFDDALPGAIGCSGLGFVCIFHVITT
jgi:hypothetical protein